MLATKELTQKLKMALQRWRRSSNNCVIENGEMITSSSIKDGSVVKPVSRSYSKLIFLGKRTLRNGEAIEKTSFFKRKVIIRSNEARSTYLCFSKIKFLSTIEADHDETLWIKEIDGPVWVYPGGTRVAYDDKFIEGYKVKPSSTVDYDPMSEDYMVKPSSTVDYDPMSEDYMVKPSSTIDYDPMMNQITSNKQPICKYFLGYVDDVSTLANDETDPDHRHTSFWGSSQVTIGSNVATIVPSQTQIHSEAPINTVPTPLVWAVVRDVSGIIFHVKATAIVITAVATGVKLLSEFWQNNREQHEESFENQYLDNDIPLVVEIPANLKLYE